MAKDEVGTTHNFVLAQGFAKIGSYDALLGADGTKRLFAELHADPDRPDVRPQEAYHALLTSMQPGWTLRLLQVFWPDPPPREVFFEQAKKWQDGYAEGLSILHQGLLLGIQGAPLPFSRRTILEFVYMGEEGLAWWMGIEGIVKQYGIHLTYLQLSGIAYTIEGLLNPKL
jgi:hypothetical protein